MGLTSFRASCQLVAWVHITFFLITRVLCIVPPPSSSSSTTRKEIKLDGDVILGGLFPIHEKGQDGELCGKIKLEKGMQRLEAMLFAVDRINRDRNLLPTIHLGVHILDTCLRDTYALEQALDFIKARMTTLDAEDYRCSDDKPPMYTPAKPVAGVIGAAASPVSIMVANILRLFQIPQISYASTGVELSDKSRFEYFSRVVPPDNFQAQAMVDLVSMFGWTYVSTLADEGNYGERGISTFEQFARKSDICIATSLRIPRELKKHTFDTILKELYRHEKARVVVMFVNEDNIRHLLRASEAYGANQAFVWLASDSWGAKTYPVVGQELLAEGSVTLLPLRTNVKEFDEWFMSLRPVNNTRNPWFIEYWEDLFKCTFNERTDSRHAEHSRCTGHERLQDLPGGGTLVQEGLVPFVVDAVHAMAHGIHSLHKRLCRPHEKVCPQMLPLASHPLLQSIRNVEFTGTAGLPVRFDPNGDAIGRYDIYQFQRKADGHFGYVQIGNWTEGKLKIDLGLLTWPNNSATWPVSVCSEPCQPGWARHSKGTQVACCWVCVKCTDYEILKNEYTCWECQNGSYPNLNKTRCLQLPILYMNVDSPWAIVPMVFSTLGILATLFVLLVFVRFNKTPIIMASGRELCYVLLFGLTLCYSMTFVLVSKPNFVSCALLRIGSGLSLAICYSALFTKTNRISRIFNRGIKAMVKRPSYTSPRSQLMICSCLVFIQMMGAVTWLIMELPGTRYEYPDRLTVILRCGTTNFAIVTSLLYNMLLIVLCTVYAFKTRKIPENYNEAKYIAFTMYSTCIVWLAFIPIYFGTKNDFKIQITALCMCLSISAAVALSCLFFPKVYIVLFQPHKNVRQTVASALNPTASRGRTLFGRQQGLAGMNGNVASPTGLALLLAQSTVRMAGGAKPRVTETHAAGGGGGASGSGGITADEDDSIRDLESYEPDSSEPETHL